MKRRILTGLLACCLSLSLALPGFAAGAIPSPGEVSQVVTALGILDGSSGGDLELSRNVTRAEFITMALKASPNGDQVGEASTSPYPDVPYTHWAAGYVEAGVAAGLITGFSDGTFRPSNPISLAECATIVLQLLGYGGGYAMSSDETQVDTGMFQSLGGISFYTRFLAKAMLGSSAAGNFFAFLGITVAMAAVAIGLSVLLYRRAIAMSVEGGANTKRKVKTDEHVNKGTFRALVTAQVKTLSRTPDILVNLILTMAMPALIAVIMGFVMPSGAEIAAEDPDAAMPYFGYFAVGLVVWITMFTSPLSNIGASFAFSLDKDNIAVLKSLPVTGKEVFKSKLIVSDAVSLLSAIAVTTALIATADIPVWGCFIFMISLTVYLISCNAFTMSRDVANPHFNWMNVKELTKASNSATQFIMMGVGLAFGLVAAMPMFAVAFAGAALPGWAVHLIAWGAMALSCLSAYPILRLTAMRGIEEKYARIEG